MINNNNLKGGNVLASGGFGCIFQPALKCKDSILGPEPGEVSKLMTEKHAITEYSQIQTFKKILEKIPNYEEYFLVKGFSLCKPTKLSKEDKNNFRKCKALTKKGFTENNINEKESLDKLLIINMPNGGIDVKNYFAENGLIVFINLNNALVDLLINGITPMNELDLYHCDIKGGNILVSLNNSFKNSIDLSVEERNSDKSNSIKSDSINTRLIDWGLSVNNKDKSGIPRKLYRRPFQYNVPWSNILFNHVFTERYSEFLLECKERKEVLDLYLLREFTMNYIFEWNKVRGSGHLKTINSFMQLLIYNELPNIESKKVKKHVIEYDFTYYYIIEYISQILLHFTKNDEFQLLEYFNTVFIKNIDIWGLVMTYSVIIKYLMPDPTSSQMPLSSQKKLVDKIKYIMFHYLFEAPSKAIDVEKVATELQSLNTLISGTNPDINNNIVNNDLKTKYGFKGGSKGRKSNKSTRKGRRRNYKKTYKKR